MQIENDPFNSETTKNMQQTLRQNYRSLAEEVAKL